MKKILVLILALFAVFFVGCGDNHESDGKYKVTYVVGEESYWDFVEAGGQAVKYSVKDVENGYVFSGWYKDAKFESKYNFNKEVNSDLTLYAKISKIYTITFDDMQGNTKRESVIEGERMVGYVPVSSDEDLVFSGWYLDSNLTIKYNEVASVKEDLVLYAKYDEGRYTVTFEDNNENVENKVVKVYEFLAEYTPTKKEGYTFSGWYLEPELVNKFSYSTKVTENITLYAKYTKELEIEYIKDEDIFNQNEEEYYVFFVKENCPYCIEAKPLVNDAYKKINAEGSELKGKVNIYQVVLKETGYMSKIFRSYKGENGQGTDNKYYVDGVTKWDDLYIATTPSIIKISVVEEVKTATYVAQGKTKVIAFVNELVE